VNGWKVDALHHRVFARNTNCEPQVALRFDHFHESALGLRRDLRQIAERQRYVVFDFVGHLRIGLDLLGGGGNG
jgi:hypothetical protein